MLSDETRTAAAFHYWALAMSLCARCDVVAWADEAFLRHPDDPDLLELTLARDMDDNDVMRLLKNLCLDTKRGRAIELLVTAIAIDLARGETLRWVLAKLRELGDATGTGALSNIAFDIEIGPRYEPRSLADTKATLYDVISCDDRWAR